MSTMEGAVDTAWEYIFEQYRDLKYELDGPEGYDRDQKKQLKEDGEWEAELARWEEPPAEIRPRLESACDALLWAMDACAKARNLHQHRLAKILGYWPGPEPYSNKKLRRLQVL